MISADNDDAWKVIANKMNESCNVVSLHPATKGAVISNQMFEIQIVGLNYSEL